MHAHPAAILHLDLADGDVIYTGRENDYPLPEAAVYRDGTWAIADVFDQWG